MVLAINLFATAINGMLMFVLLSLTTNSLYCFTKSKNFFLFFANLLKKPVNSAGDICLPLRGSFNLWKKWSLSFPNSTSSGDNCASAYFSTWSKSDLAISAISNKSFGFGKLYFKIRLYLSVFPSPCKCNGNSWSTAFFFSLSDGISSKKDQPSKLSK